MGSPITLSGFNQIDFNVVLNAVMQQESRPLQALQKQQNALQKTDTAYATLATKLGALQSSAADLAGLSTVLGNAATSSDEQSVGVSATSDAVPGRYEVVVSTLARAQVTASSSTTADSNTTAVATGGTLTIGGIAVSVAGSLTLQGLADAINNTTGMSAKASASVIESSPGQFRLVLTGASTGVANAFTVTNGLTGSTVTFTDTNADGTSGDSALDNAVQATNAALTINNISVTSTSNTLTTAIPNVTLTLGKADPLTTVVVSVSRDDQDLIDRLQSFITAYNDVAKFASDQATASSALDHGAVLRGLHAQLRSVLSGAHGSGTYTRLAEIGVGFTRTGQLTLDSSRLKEALTTSPDGVSALFADASTGAFGATRDLVKDYVGAGGFLPGARTQLTDQLSRLNNRMASMERLLAIRRAALQREYSAADQAISRLNSQSGSLASFAGKLSSSGL